LKQMRIIRLGSPSDALLCNITFNLNSIQSEFIFQYNDSIKYPDNLDTSNPVPITILEEIILDYIRKRYPGEYPIAVCDCPLEENVLTSADENSTLITTYNAEQRFYGISILKAILFALIDPLLSSLGIVTQSHYENQACPADYWADNPKSFKKSIDKCDFCPDCLSVIDKDANTGKISIAQLASLYRILDFIADRRICFIIMPFNKIFDDLYNSYLKPTLCSFGWNCIRADEIYEPKEIINIIYQQIHRAHLIIADLTGRNSNVFYELGYAHAIGKNTILLSQDIDDVPFDLRHRQIIKYHQNNVSFKELISSLTKYI